MRCKSFALLLACTSLSAARARAEFIPGDILLNNLGSSNSSNIQQYSPSGVLKQTFTGTGEGWQGASLTQGGNLVTTFRNNGPSGPGVDIFSPNGTQIASFSTTQVSAAGDVSVFPDGTLAISDQVGSRGIALYSQIGTYRGTLALPGASNPLGNVIAADGSLWVTDVTADRLFHLNESGTVLANFAVGFNPTDVVVDRVDGSLWVSDFGAPTIHHLSSTGLDLGNFSSAAPGRSVGIGFAPNGALWTTSDFASNLYQYSTTGDLLTQFPLVDTGAFPFVLTVVPASVPEPSSFMLAILSFIALAALRRRRA
jgi:streptogramin lyase